MLCYLMISSRMALFFYVVSSLFLFPWTSTSFTLKLVHRDSPHSPLYKSNLSDFDRFIKHIESTNARASYFAQTPPIRLPLKFVEPIFTVEIGLGTPVVKQVLILDTGSSLTWTQCRPCLKCFKQDRPLFDTKKSGSYKKLTKRQSLSNRFKCTPLGCFYYTAYFSGQITSGIVSTENFTFPTSLGNPYTVPGLVFGCGQNNYGKFPSATSGILGMGKEPESFARQLGTLTQGRFSYCLSKNTKESFVTFGDEAKIPVNNVKRTPFLKGNIGNMFYTTNLRDISINGQSLRLTSAMFPGGCVIDSGSSISLLNKRAFSTTTTFLAAYFSKLNVKRYVGKDVPDGLFCYIQLGKFVKMPSMTFHFQGADYYIPPENLFLNFKSSRLFCLAMMGSANTNILGAHQQTNVRMVYDLKQDMLSFAPENCAK